MESIVLLNSDYTPINTIHWRKAIKLLVKERVEPVGKAFIVIKTTAKEIIVPKVLRLVKMVRQMYKNRVPYSKKNVHIRDGFECAYCGSKSNLTVDHVVPRSRGGGSVFENVVTACFSCNNSKNDKTPSEVGLTLKKKPYHPTISEFIRIRMEKLGAMDILNEIFSHMGA